MDQPLPPTWTSHLRHVVEALKPESLININEYYNELCEQVPPDLLQFCTVITLQLQPDFTHMSLAAKSRYCRSLALTADYSDVDGDGPNFKDFIEFLATNAAGAHDRPGPSVSDNAQAIMFHPASDHGSSSSEARAATKLPLDGNNLKQGVRTTVREGGGERGSHANAVRCAYFFPDLGAASGGGQVCVVEQGSSKLSFYDRRLDGAVASFAPAAAVIEAIDAKSKAHVPIWRQNAQGQQRYNPHTLAVPKHFGGPSKSTVSTQV